MSSLYDEILGSVTLFAAKITIGVTASSAKVNGRKDVIEEIGVLEDMEAFVEEITPIMKKYSAKTAEKVRAFIAKDRDKAIHKIEKWIAEENH